MSIIIAGERSGVGKTTVTLSLLASLCRRGAVVQSFKVGPDYIDPMFHQYVTGRPCRNLDPVLTSETYVQQCFTHHSQGSEYVLVEGVMGLFDGVGTNNFASTAHIARLLDIPTILVIDCSRLSGSVAAIAHGYGSFDSRVKMVGVVLNRVGSDRHLSLLQDALAPLELPILGILRRQEQITMRDRHLGLVPTDELPELDTLIHHLANIGDSCFNWEKLLPLLESTANITPPVTNVRTHNPQTKIRIAIARDRAFNFYYQDNLDLLQQLGAELIFWSPLADFELPKNIQGMFFGGGFPEVFASQLAANVQIRAAVKSAILQGMPTIAECGGLMYLCEEIIDFDSKSWSMVGVLPTSAKMVGSLILGYRRAVALQDNLLVDAGTNICGHEFHRSQLTSHPHQPLFTTYRYDSEESLGFEGWRLFHLHASYIHQHWGDNLKIPQRFIQECIKNWPLIPTS